MSKSILLADLEQFRSFSSDAKSRRNFAGLALAACLMTLAPAHAGDAETREVLAAQAGLAVDLIDRTLAKEGAANIMVSPASLAAALGLASSAPRMRARRPLPEVLVSAMP